MRRTGPALQGVGTTVYTGNRGMGFENVLEYSNVLYKQQGVAIINKRPTPVKIMGPLGPGLIKGYLEKPSTVDFDGTLLGGRSIVFEAKEVTSRDYFKLSDIADHQVEYLEDCHRLGGISFVIINFPKYDTTYLVPFITFRHYLNRWKTGGGARGTASIHKDDLDVHAFVVESGRVPVDYLAVVRKVWKLDEVA